VLVQLFGIYVLQCASFFEYEKQFPREFFAKKRFIELGSGVGLLGISVASMGSHIILTEQKKMIQILQANIRKNIQSEIHKVETKELNWGTDISSLKPPFDVIIGSDLCYESDHILELIQSLKDLSNENTLIFLGHEERKMDCESIFYTVIYKYFDYEKIPANSLDKRFKNFNGWILKMKKRKEPREDN